MWRRESVYGRSAVVLCGRAPSVAGPTKISQSRPAPGPERRGASRPTQNRPTAPPAPRGEAIPPSLQLGRALRSPGGPIARPHDGPYPPVPFERPRAPDAAVLEARRPALVELGRGAFLLESSSKMDPPGPPASREKPHRSPADDLPKRPGGTRRTPPVGPVSSGESRRTTKKEQCR